MPLSHSFKINHIKNFYIFYACTQGADEGVKVYSVEELALYMVVLSEMTLALLCYYPLAGPQNVWVQ